MSAVRALSRSANALVEARELVRDFPIGTGMVHALRAIDLSVARGQLVAVVGRSGSGKTTLLNLIGGLDRPTSGQRPPGRPGARPPSRVGAGPAAPPAGRIRLPGVRPAAHPVGGGERRGADAPAAHRSERAQRAGAQPARAGGPRRAPRPPAARALGRGAAARRAGPRACQPSRAAGRGRADRAPGLADRAHDHAAHPVTGAQRAA